MVDDTISLNVGGKRYTVRRSTLTADPDSDLAEMFKVGVKSGPMTPATDKLGNCYLDYDGKTFRYILQYLRHKKDKMDVISALPLSPCELTKLIAVSTLLNLDELRDISLEMLLKYNSDERSHATGFPLLANLPATVYAGFDPTAESLHLGHLVVICAMLHLRAAGFDVIFVVGGGTAKLGDPTGRNEDRLILSDDQLLYNSRSITNQLTAICGHFDSEVELEVAADGEPRKRPLNPVIIENNESWFQRINVLEYFDCVGRAFRLRHMMSKQCVSNRMAHAGMSYGEFSYQVLQAYDWLHLYRTRSCLLQLGGNDQLGNIHSGRDLIRHACGRQAYGLLVPLLVSDSGHKMGKSSGEVSIWLDRKLCTPYAFFQHFLRMPDAEVRRSLELLSFFSQPEVENIVKEHSRYPERRLAQLKLARQLTVLVHGASGLQKALRTTEVLFEKPHDHLFEMDDLERQTVIDQLPHADLTPKPHMTVEELALSAGCFDTVEEAEAVIRSGGFSVNNFRLKDPMAKLSPEVINVGRKFSLLRVGKRSHYIVLWK
ncbi:unnamed protein product [Soboliphyme baturini]|uniref:Tyrosine--tRNA ligase n=1 Tax=Soboliphyme baturini TaxID=241478 RepID=A0A183IW80_9BILA|nr:unnamed protein product [Soboliphyme baturini]